MNSSCFRRPFIDEDFLLASESAKRLYHDYAASMPIIDYHCHLPVQEVAEDRTFENMTQIWLAGDHYKWRAMRAAGVDEKYITGDASDWEKFQHWAGVLPQTVRNPLFHWTALELRRPFGITDKILAPETSEEIWNCGNEMLAKPEFSARGIMKQMNVRAVCTTDDPADDLRFHQRLAADFRSGNFNVKVLPAFRPDAAVPVSCDTKQGAGSYCAYLNRLGKSAGIQITSFENLLAALQVRHAYFHENGCRLADHGFGAFRYTETASPSEADSVLKKILAGEPVSSEETLPLESLILLETARMHAAAEWGMQLHIGALRNNAFRILNCAGRDAGCDSMADGAYMKPLSRFLDQLDSRGELPKTIVYNLNPDSTYALASMIANFNDGSLPGKMQYGSGWWFLDQYHGMREQLEAVSTMGLLSRFVGMLTDSRSFLSYTRHEYFRRILCGLLGEDMEKGFIPNDFDWIGSMVQDICYNNAENYFGF